MALNELAIVSSRIAGLRMFPALFSIVSLPSGVWLALGWTHHSIVHVLQEETCPSLIHCLARS